MLQYTDFELILDEGRDGYRLEARGPGVSISDLPVVFDLQGSLKQELARVKLGFPPSRQRLEQIGRALFTALFPTQVFAGYIAAQAAQPEILLRLKITVRTDALSQLPWELLFDPYKNTFLAARTPYPLVRFVGGNSLLSLPTLSNQPLDTIRLLYLEANPAGTAPLNLAASRERIQQALGRKAEITVITETTIDDLQDALRHQAFHILHYAGHAEFDEKTGTGQLNLHQPDGTVAPLSTELLATLLDVPSLRLVVFSACQTAADGQQRRFSGIAQRLMVTSNRLLAAVAMQYQMADESASAFSESFYEALADNYPVEAAVVEGRKGILSRYPDQDPFAASDWATPVLFMRSDNGYVLHASQEESEKMTETDKEQPADNHHIEVDDGAAAVGQGARAVGQRGIYIGGNANKANIVTGDRNVIGNQNIVDSQVQNQRQHFQILYQTIDERTGIDPADKADLKAEVKEVEAHVIDKGDEADETFLERRLRNIRRIAPDILDVVLATLGNPAAGLGVVAKKVADRMRGLADA